MSSRKNNSYTYTNVLVKTHQVFCRRWEPLETYLWLHSHFQRLWVGVDVLSKAW